MNILTFDIEEWFHLLDNESTKPRKNGKPILAVYIRIRTGSLILERHDQKATFFIIEWIAKRYPEIVKRINNKGYDIGFHTNLRQLICDRLRKSFMKI